MTDLLLENQQLAEDTVGWLEARLVQTRQGAIFPHESCRLDLLSRCETLLRPRRMVPDRPYPVDVECNCWDRDLWDGCHLLREALGGDPFNAAPGVVSTRLGDPAPVAQLMTSLKLVASGYRKTREQLLGLSVGADAERSAVDNGDLSPARASPDFRSVHWYGSNYSFTALQAAVVRELWAAWEQETPDLSDAYLLTKADSQGDRLVDLFSGHPAWRTMIVEGATKGTRRLNPRNT